jgi:O-antigen ligase
LLLGAAVAPHVLPWSRIVAAGVIVLALTTGALGLNRSFIPIVALTILLFVALHFSGMKVERRIKLRAALASALVLSIASSAFIWVTQQRVGPQLALSEVVQRTVAEDPRLKIWRYSVSQIAEHPITGTGFGRMAQAKKFQVGTGDDSGVHPHNIVLSYGIQMGVAGILVVLLLFGAIVRRCIGLYRDPDPTLRLIGMTGLCVIVAVLLKSTVDDLFVRHNAWLFWSLLGMGFGYAERSRAERERA